MAKRLGSDARLRGRRSSKQDGADCLYLAGLGGYVRRSVGGEGGPQRSPNLSKEEREQCQTGEEKNRNSRWKKKGKKIKMEGSFKMTSKKCYGIIINSCPVCPSLVFTLLEVHDGSLLISI